MPIEAPFFIAIAGVSASLAGLAGLVAALRRGEGLATVDRYRLREIVEFAFANIIFALAVFPLSALIGDLEVTLRLLSVAVVVYLVAYALVLLRRQRRQGIPLVASWLYSVLALNVLAITLALLTAISGSIGAYAGVLLTLLARPMLAFVFVLLSFDEA